MSISASSLGALLGPSARAANFFNTLLFGNSALDLCGNSALDLCGDSALDLCAVTQPWTSVSISASSLGALLGPSAPAADFF